MEIGFVPFEVEVAENVLEWDGLEGLQGVDVLVGHAFELLLGCGTQVYRVGSLQKVGVFN